MSDLKSERWLWIKGGLFVVIAMLSVFLLAVDFTRSRQMVLLMLAIWASCRAYYFCFYVIEKYIDREYRFAGLVYLPQYMLRRWRGSPSSQPNVRTDESEEPSLSWFVFWPCVFGIGNLVVPALAPTYIDVSELLPDEYVITFVLSILSGQIAFLSVFAAYAQLPFKFRIPIAIGLCWLITFLFFAGMTPWRDFESIFVNCILAMVIVCMGSGILVTFSYWTGKRLLHERFEDSREDREGADGDGKLGNRLSIRYLLGATTLAAILSAGARFFDFELLNDKVFWIALLLSVLLSTIVYYITILCLEFFLQPAPFSCRASLLVPWCVCMLLFPFAAYYLAFWLGSANDVSSLGEDIPYLAFFEVSYVLMLAIMFWHARSQGIRFAKSKLTDSQVDKKACVQNE